MPDEEEPDAVFFYMGDGVGADLASSSTIAEPEFRAAKLPTITEVDEPEPRVRSEVIGAVRIEVLEPRRPVGNTPNLFEGME